jgi:hypothetical protein
MSSSVATTVTTAPGRGGKDATKLARLIAQNACLSYHLLIAFTPMNSTHRKTLAVIFSKPTARTLEWSRIEALLGAVGARVIEGSGSRVRFELNGEIANFHRPHPAKEAKSYQVDDARTFLTASGIMP